MRSFDLMLSILLVRTSRRANDLVVGDVRHHDIHVTSQWFCNMMAYGDYTRACMYDREYKYVSKRILSPRPRRSKPMCITVISRKISRQLHMGSGFNRGSTWWPGYFRKYIYDLLGFGFKWCSSWIYVIRLFICLCFTLCNWVILTPVKPLQRTNKVVNFGDIKDTKTIISFTPLVYINVLVCFMPEFDTQLSNGRKIEKGSSRTKWLFEK